MEFTKLLITIPTRNRSDLAINAINSVLTQKNCDFELFVSDNSTEEEEVKKLSTFCARLDDSRLTYIRPPKSFSMTEHWDWIIEQVFRLSSASHFIFLADRSVFKKDALEKLEKIVKLYPTQLVSYLGDEVYDDTVPVTLRQISWSGNLYKVKSEHMIQTLASRILPAFCTPRMSNCAVPRQVLQNIKNTFGNYFSSVAPDYNFGFSYALIFDALLFLDAPLILSYGLDRSNGANSSKGRYQKDVKDFQANIGDKFKISFDSPIESILPFTNAVLHEYYAIKNNNLNAEKKFPEINQWMYLRTLFGEVLSLENKELKKKLLTQFYKNVGVKAAEFHLRAKFPVKKWLTLPFTDRSNVLNTKDFILTSSFQSTDEAIKYDEQFPREQDNSPENLMIKLGINKVNDENVKIIEGNL
jgi:glycosyltransferase involved in cell wall biosynthesis